MSKQDLRIVYMGTPEFAVPSLDILVKNNFNIVGVITAPDKKAGRGQKIKTSAVKDAAEKYGLRILQPTNLKSPEFLDELKSLNANLQIVVAFRMLPEVVWNMPKLGTFNLHGSLLPQYRGAAPINWAVMNGEKETGVTTFFLKHEIDTGNLILQDPEPILEKDTVGTVYERLMHKGASLVLKTVQSIESNNIEATPQNEDQELKHAPKIFKDTCKIDWNKSAEEVYNHIRGLSPYPAAWTEIKDKTMKIYWAEKTNEVVDEPIVSDGKTYLKFACSDYYLDIKEVQLQGKKRLSIEEFLRGFRI